MEQGLAFFSGMLDSRLSDAPDHSAEKGDERADEWEKGYNDPARAKSDHRIQSAVRYLSGHGLLAPDCDVADIGCGPGRFAAAFAKTAHHVLGLDISEKMIAYGTAYVKQQGLENVSFRVCDFQALDIDAENLTAQFDLVFSSITPAIHGMNGLEKSIRMSRKYCCNITHLCSRNELERRIMREVFNRDYVDPWLNHWRWFYATFNALFLMGYYPEATYDQRREQRAVVPGPERVKLFMERMLPVEERTTENEERINQWMAAHAAAAGTDGTIEETSEVWYGRLLWDVRRKTERRF
jgi:SAM-dependent methyltransferase